MSLLNVCTSTRAHTTPKATPCPGGPLSASQMQRRSDTAAPFCMRNRKRSCSARAAVTLGSDPRDPLSLREADARHRRLASVADLSTNALRTSLPTDLPTTCLAGEGADARVPANHFDFSALTNSADLHENSSQISSPTPSEGGLFGFLESKLSPRVRGLILLNMLTFLYGSNVTVVKEAQASIDPFSFSFGRFTIAAIAFAPFLGKALVCPPVRRAGLELGIWASVAYVAQAVGLLTTEAGRAAFIGTFTVIEVPIIAGLFGAKIPRITWWAAAAAVLGVGCLESAGGNSSLMGDFWTLVSALVFGFHMLRSEHHTRHVPAEGALPLIALQLAVTSVMSFGWVVAMSHLGLVPSTSVEALTGHNWEVFVSWPWLQMAYTGVLSTAFCLWVEVVSLRDVSASEAVMVYTLEPLYGAGFAWVLLGERWGPIGWVGAALILGGSLTMQLWERVECPEDEPEEVEQVKSSGAILGALGVAAAMSLIMVAMGEVPGLSARVSGPVVEGVVSAELVATEVAWGMGALEVEVESLSSLMRVYALLKGDHLLLGGGGEGGVL